MRSSGVFGACVGALLAASLGGGSPQDTLAPTPLIYSGPGAKPLIENSRANDGRDDLQLIYVTDRAPVTDPATGALSYNAQRSRFMSFGTIDVAIRSPSASGEKGELKLGTVAEVGRFPGAPIPPS